MGVLAEARGERVGRAGATRSVTRDLALCSVGVRAALVRGDAFASSACEGGEARESDDADMALIQFDAWCFELLH